ncbi:MAG TPA: GNAT family N-acetyltransferase [Flavobacteriales bacterium]|nr:GNAT family N-acetyltransferase [Flavobacteriales bacterium]HIA10473.1 GNAT family N-acetyltransferase [Flavobacteriales bacterium]
MEIVIRKAEKKDMVDVHCLIVELALFENAAEQVAISVEDLERDGFEGASLFNVLLAENDGEIAGMAFYYSAYSTWKGKMLYLDDLVVLEKYRKHGVGQLLIDAIKSEANSEHANQVRFHVLNWNETAINFYKKNNVSLDDEWILCKIEKDGIG